MQQIVMRNALTTIIAGALIAVVSCTEAPTETPTEAELKQLSARKPNWQQNQVGYEGPVVQSKVRILDKRFLGDLPEQYIQGNWWAMGGPVAYQDFGEFQNEFFYADEKSSEYFKADPIVMKVFRPAFGARARDRTGRVVAEARLLEIGRDGAALAGQATIEEFHYGKDGNVVFYARSVIRQDKKERELVSIGHKTREYFSLYHALADKFPNVQ
ncbi:MAG: hypothetical protein AAB444_03040 [Patescibacteria group bacterium]